MRLLDRVARCHAPLHLALDGAAALPFEVTGASQYASRVADCPLRFVLNDDLTRASAELAFADGARLAGCLDLLRVPAPRLWVEWNDAVHQQVIYETGTVTEYDAAASGRRVGVLLQGSADGHHSIARTFWVDAAAEESADVVLSPLETHIDLRGGQASAADLAGVLAGGFATVNDSANAAMSSLLDHVKFRFDEPWAAYYRAAATSPTAQRQVVHACLAAVARDVPLLLAFFLLLSAKDATRSVPVSRAALNRKRMANGRAPLLDHIEVHASLDAVWGTDTGGSEPSGRQSPRLHHVRGHLVRRDDRVFWRSPHLRGSGTRGMVRSRTVCLS
ncbi:MAG: hypothetical protein WA803_10695, partial [Steroidobacteraceae bacterium]